MALDREHLTRLTKEPGLASGEDVADLRELVQRYPWFSGAHLLLAVGGHRQGDVLFEEQLRASVAHLPSRAVLHDRLHEMRATPPKRSAPAPESVAPVDASSAAVAGGEALVNAAAQTPAEAVPEIRTAPTPAVGSAAGMPAGEAPVNTAAQTPAEAVPPPRTATSPVVEPAPGLAAAEAHTPAAPEGTAVAAESAAEDPLDVQMRQAAQAARYALMLEHPAIAGAPTLDDVLSPTGMRTADRAAAPVEARPSVRRFSAWLDAPAVATPAEQPPKAATEDGYADTQALIERFIQQQGQGAQKTPFYSPVQAARRSVEEHPELVTETLARIFEQQGNVQKAIAAYERLAGRHPERSAHFQEQVARLKARSGPGH